MLKYHNIYIFEGRYTPSKKIGAAPASLFGGGMDTKQMTQMLEKIKYLSKILDVTLLKAQLMAQIQNR